MHGPHAHAAKAEAMQQKADRRLMKHNTKTLFNLRFDVHASPAHKIALRRFRHHRRDFFFLLWGQAAHRVAFGSIIKTAQTILIVAMNPVTQRLPIHPNRLCCRNPIHAVQNVGYPQHPARRKRVFLCPRLLP